jgi:putative hemolysin
MAFIIIILLIILNGYFSLAEIALISVSDAELSGEQSKNNPNAFAVLQLIKDPEEFLSAVQVGITLLGLLEGIYGGDMVAAELQGWFTNAGMNQVVAHISSLVIGIGATTYLAIVFGELVPKTIALQMPLKISLAIAPSLRLFSEILFPFIKLLTVSTRAILSAFSIKASNNEKVTEKDLKRILSTAYKQGILGKQQLFLHENVFTFDHLTAKNIMKPARIVLTLSYDWSREQVIAVIRKRPYSFFPVYKGEPGNVIGVLGTKDFFLNERANWHNSITSNCSVPKEMTARDIFNKFKEKKLDFAIVSGETKPFIGIVAMQDVMEGVFGDLPEREDYALYFFQKSDKQWIAEGFIHLQRIRNTLSLPWLRAYEQKYLSLSELLAGELSEVKNQDTLVLNGVSFKIIAGTATDPQTIQITLP